MVRTYVRQAADRRKFLPEFWFIAAGYVFVAINLRINGLGVCLPTTFGYAMIAVGTWLLRDHRPLRLGVVPAVLLAIVTFPELFRVERWAYWPSMLLEVLLISVVALGVRRISDRRGKEPLKWVATATIAILALSLVGWWFFPVTSNATLIASFIVYKVPALFLAAVCAVAAQQLA